MSSFTSTAVSTSSSSVVLAAIFFFAAPEQQTQMVILPMYHSYGLGVAMLHKLSVGLKLVTLPRFHPDTFLKAMREHKTNIMYLAPPMG